MKDNELKVTIIELEDKRGFSELITELQVAAVMRICPPKFKMQVFDNVLKQLAKLYH